MPALPKKSALPEKPKTFSKLDALALVGRLSAQWPYLTAELGREDVLAAEYAEQFAGYHPQLVSKAVTIAVGKATKYAPTVGEIKAELRAMIAPPAMPSWKATDDETKIRTPEEIERRKKVCADLRKQYGLGSSSEDGKRQNWLERLDKEPMKPISDIELENLRELTKGFGSRIRSTGEIGD